MSKGRVDSASIMANGPAFESALRGARHWPHCSFGIHLNLTEFEPLSYRQMGRLLTDANGRLHRGILRNIWKPTLLRAAYQELCAQIERLLAYGVSISHIDSHHHIHTVPCLFPVIKALQRRYDIRKIRISKNIYTGQIPASPSLRAKKAMYNWALRIDSHTTEGFTDLISFIHTAGSSSIRQRTIEVMVHPGAPQCGPETALLESRWEKTLPFEVVHLNYTGLVKSFWS